MTAKKTEKLTVPVELDVDDISALLTIHRLVEQVAKAKHWDSSRGVLPKFRSFMEKIFVPFNETQRSAIADLLEKADTEHGIDIDWKPEDVLPRA